MDSASFSSIAVAGPNISTPDDKLLTNAANQAVRYWDVGTIATSFAQQKPSILIYKVTALEEARSLASANPELKERLLVVIDAVDLLIPGSDCCLSWDQTLKTFSTDTMEKFHLLIRLDHDGAIYRPPSKDNQILIFDPRNVQGHFFQSLVSQDNKDILKANLEAAYLAGLAASLAKESPKSLGSLCETQIKEAATIALRWSRRYAAAKQAKMDKNLATWHNIKLDTPDDPVLVPVRVPLQVGAQCQNSLIFNTLPFQPPKEAAWDIVKNGAERILSFVPTARFNKFVVVDSQEVEMFRKIARGIETYLRDNPRLVPHPIAVFGQPGSGKSFGVKAVITSILQEAKQQDDMELLEFNLSQFQGLSDLQAAFETIRDKYMAGKLPVVLFDEFDTPFQKTKLFWLQHLLGPIQNGKFTVHIDGQLHARSLGRGIYAFIGGTVKTFEEFKEPSSGIKRIDPPANNNNNHGGGAEAQRRAPSGCASIDEFLTRQLGNQRGKTHHFEVSQNKGYHDLVEFFYKARECTNFSTLPIVYVEGFDTELDVSGQLEPLGWLKYFLAPMQDGSFIDNGHSRPLGRAIFVFIGKRPGPIQEFLCNPKQRGAPFQEAKGPDFVSRLRGIVSFDEDAETCLKNVVERYMNRKESKPLSLAVLRTTGEEQTGRGHTEHKEEVADADADANANANKTDLDQQDLNANEDPDFAHLIGDNYIDVTGPNEVADTNDNMFQVRRAILLRSMLDRIPQRVKFELSNEVLNAMLGVKSFHHGARSMEAILSMSKLPETNGKLTRAHLPEDNQLRLHVDVKEFQGLLVDPHIPGQNPERDRQIVLRAAEIAWNRARINGQVAPGKMDFRECGLAEVDGDDYA